nr:unnamed protein product [Digitaria exilis]
MSRELCVVCNSDRGSQGRRWRRLDVRPRTAMRKEGWWRRLEMGSSRGELLWVETRAHVDSRADVLLRVASCRQGGGGGGMSAGPDPEKTGSGDGGGGWAPAAAGSDAGCCWPARAAAAAPPAAAAAAAPGAAGMAALVAASAAAAGGAAQGVGRQP